MTTANTHTEQLDTEITEDDYDLLHLAQNEEITADVAAELASSRFPEVRMFLALNKSTPTETLRTLTEDTGTVRLGNEEMGPLESVEVRRFVAQNPNATADMLTKLYGVANVVHVATHPNASPELLASVAEGSDSEAWLVAGHASTPEELRKALADHENEMVAARARHYGRTTTGTVAETAEEREKQAMSLDTPVNVLAELSRSDDSEIVELVADNPMTPREVLEEILTNTDEYDSSDIRRSLAGNWNTAPDSLSSLMADDDRKVAKYAWQNPNSVEWDWEYEVSF